MDCEQYARDIFETLGNRKTSNEFMNIKLNIVQNIMIQLKKKCIVFSNLD